MHESGQMDRQAESNITLVNVHVALPVLHRADGVGIFIFVSVNTTVKP